MMLDGFQVAMHDAVAVKGRQPARHSRKI